MCVVGRRRTCWLLIRVLLALNADAIICCDDVMAMGRIDAARSDLKLNVPGALSAIGFNGAGPPAGCANCRSTTVGRRVALMAGAAVKRLLARLKNPALPTEKRVLKGKLAMDHSGRLALDLLLRYQLPVES